ncbi:MAG: CRISPR-associated protein Csm5 [Gammaproteobacteria bacterium]|jgi:CRISPR-associated protein Csm5|nr:CRISPR-associated protein Csm5 [Gammaproteobacteria bacterium]
MSETTRHAVHQLALTALSPLHIGTGQDLDPTGYVIDGEDLYRFSPEAALRALSATAREELDRILGAAPTVELIKQVQAFFHRNREALIAEAEQAMPVLPSIAEEYRQRVGRTAQQEQDRDIINQLQIARSYADERTGRPILPGSSLKGAIRTALLDLENDGQPPQRGERSRDLQQRVFRYRQFDLDPMRLVQVGDARDQSAADSYATEVRYAVNRKREAVFRNGRELAAQAERLRQVLECVPPLRPPAFTGLLGVQDVNAIASPKLPDPSLRWTFEDIAHACNRFYQPILKREMQELGNRGYLAERWGASILQLLADKQPQLEGGQAFLLRVGRHSGAESVTLNGVRSIKIMGARGEKAQYLNAAKTVWLAAGDIQQRTELLPFGWVLVEAAPIGEALPRWPAGLLEQFAAFTTEQEQTWSQRVSARRHALREAAAERRAREQQRAEEAARAQREAEEQAARRANLSDEARKLEDLRERLAQDQAAGRNEKGGELANQLVAVLSEAEQEWSGPACGELADLAEAIYAFIGWPAKKKKQARKEQIAAIRAKA